MPAFTFEKIPPPVRRIVKPSSAGEPRNGLIQTLSRVVGPRVTRKLRLRSELVRHEPKLPE